MATPADQGTPSSLLLPALIVLTAVVMTLEILQRLLLARIAAVALLGVTWSVAFPPELQVRAALGALVYHSGAALLLPRRRQRGRSRFDSDHSDCNDSGSEEEEEDANSSGKDWRVIRSLLFLVRVFVWGAALAAAVAIPSVRAAGDNRSSFSFFVFVVQWWDTAIHALATMAALTSYCEVLEVLVLLYFADQDVSYRWRTRAPLWLLSSVVGVLETSGLLSFVARRLVGRISTLGLVGVLVAGMYVSVQLPWRRVVALVETVGKTKTTRLGGLFRSQPSDGEEDDEEEEGLELADDWRYTDHDREKRRHRE